MESTEEQYARALDTAEQMLGFRLESYGVAAEVFAERMATR